MTVKLLTEHNLEFLSLKGGCTGSSESTLVKMPRWKSHVTAHMTIFLYDFRLPLFQGAAVEYLAPLLALGTVDTTFCVATDSEYQLHNNIIYATRVSYYMVVRLCGMG